MSEIDNSLDEHLTEKQAIAQAKAEGLTFIDSYQVEGDSTHYKTKQEAEAQAKGKPVFQVRETIPLDVSAEE